MNKKDELVKFNQGGQWEILEKAADYNPALRTPVSTLPKGWSSDPKTGAMHHSLHGVVSVHPADGGGFTIRHGGGHVGTAKNIAEAGQKVKDHINALHVSHQGSLNVDPMNVVKGDEHQDLTCSEKDKKMAEANEEEEGASNA